MRNVCLFISFLALLGCSRSEDDKRISMALNRAGENKKELLKVLKYYENDSLKLQAASFLIKNMPYHFANEDVLVAPNGKTYYPDITLFDSPKAVSNHCDSLLTENWKIQRNTKYDIKNIQADFLIQNIDLAFDVWKKPWARSIDFEDFCQYILPYRAQNEKVSTLRKVLMEQYLPLLDSLQPRNAFDACMIIHNELRKRLRYKETGNPLQATLIETHKAGVGACEALCNYVTLAMRAVGIPVAIYNTTWTRMDGGHSWCAVLYKDKFYDFNPAEVNPDTYQDKLAVMWYLQPAKVYQRHFSLYESGNLTDDDGYITWMKNPLMEDVTVREKNSTYTLIIPANKTRSSKSGQVYLCAYNNLQWIPLAIGCRNGNDCVFENISGRNFFMIAEAVGKNDLRYISFPFLTERNGTYRMLVPNKERAISYSFNKGKDGDGTLYYWDTETEKFVPLTFKSESDSMQYYDNIPDGALLKYVLRNQTTEQKVGIILNGEYKRSGDL